MHMQDAQARAHVQSRGEDHGGGARLQAEQPREVPGEAEAGEVRRAEERACKGK